MINMVLAGQDVEPMSSEACDLPNSEILFQWFKKFGKSEHFDEDGMLIPMRREQISNLLAKIERIRNAMVDQFVKEFASEIEISGKDVSNCSFDDINLGIGGNLAIDLQDYDWHENNDTIWFFAGW